MPTTTIFLVEDDTIIREVITSVLEDAGHRVTSASDGEEAIALLADVRPDLAILDLMMPLVDGRAVLKHIRATPATRAVPVILMSASPLGASGEAPDAAVFLRKPFDLQTLLDEVTRILRKDGEAVEAHERHEPASDPLRAAVRPSPVI